MSVVTGIDFSNNGLFMVTTGRDKVIIIWNLNNNTAIKTIPVYESIECLQICNVNESTLLNNLVDKLENTKGYTNINNNNEFKELIITAGEKGIVNIWNGNGDKIHNFSIQEEQTNEVNANNSIPYLLINKQTNKIIVGTSDQNLIYYDMNNFEQLKLLIGYHDEIIDIKYVNSNNNDDKNTKLVIATNSEKVKVYDIKNEDWKIMNGHTDIVICLDVSNNNTMIITGSKDKTIKIWNTDKYKCITTCQGHTEAISAVSFGKKTSNFFLSGSRDKTIKYWNISGNSVVSRYTIKGHDKDLNALVVAPNDKIFATGSQDKLIKIWNTKDGNLIGTLKGHSRGIWSIDFSPIDKCLVSSSSDKTIKLWSITTMSCLKTFEGHGTSVLKVLYINTGTQLISSGSDGILKLWSIKNHSCVNTFDEHTDKVWSIAISKDENSLVTGGADSQIQIWNDFTEKERDDKIIQNQNQLLKYVTISLQIYLNCITLFLL